jgi:hypothetical protein
MREAVCHEMLGKACRQIPLVTEPLETWFECVVTDERDALCLLVDAQGYDIRFGFLLRRLVGEGARSIWIKGLEVPDFVW